jgi:hypothetical protein
MRRSLIVQSPCPVRPVGDLQQHYFFGYYNKTNWDRSGRYLLAQQVPYMDVRLTPDCVAGIGYFDLEHGGRFQRVSETRAWNWQMGSQLQWLDGVPGRKLIYNGRRQEAGGRYAGFGSVIVDVETDERKALPLPIYVAAPDSRCALCVDYRRLYVTHETIGYSEEGGPFELPLAPADDGLHRMDLETGDFQLVVSYRQLREFHPRESMEGAIHWVSHIEINPSSSRVLFLHRWTRRVKDETCFLHRLITMNPDGSDLRLLECSDHPLPQLAADFDPTAVGTFDYEKSEYQISHPLWRNDRQIIVWGPHGGEIHYHLYDDVDGSVQVIGRDVLTENGHMTFSPVNERWLLSDTYPDPGTHERILFLYDMETGLRHDVGSFYADPRLSKENRCDLHPRWSRNGREVCIDSVHGEGRRMYIVDVSRIVAA